ncbi:phosphorylase family protein [Sphaerisporangium aureirubrum]|uniref:Nucleoside phosphorylase domain-containing protein n=1 Tax=Sphaerisporangium aureirubrum TaxID=1544736 RepID=A0ABW1NHV8_9ACTN
MNGLVICVALGVEARAVARGLRPGDGVAVVRTGMGPRRAARAVPRLDGYRAMAVTGFGGALDDGLRPGEALVANEVRYRDRTLPCPLADELAEELAREGIPAQTGALLTCDRLVTGAARARLAATGARVVDMESWPLAEAVAADRPLAVVRVVVDTPAAPLPSLAALRGGVRARRVLRRLGPVLARWAASVHAKEGRP